MKRKGLSMLLIMTMLTMMLPNVVLGAVNVRDEEQHWGIKEMKSWQEKGLLTGYTDGTLRPDEPVTRAEITRMINSVFHYIEMKDNGFTDVNASQWFYSDIGKVAAAGIVAGYPDGTFRPNEAISREDVAKILTSAFKLQPTEDELSANLLEDYKDGSNAHQYAQPALVKLIADGTMKGYPDGTIRPLKAVTRAESIALLAALTGTIIQSTKPMKNMTIDSNLIINTPGVTLDNVTVIGDVYITAGVGEGDIHITNSKIEGVLHVNGGGVNSIYIEHTSIGELVINKLEGKVRVVIKEKSNVRTVVVEKEAIIELEKDSFIKLLNFLETAKNSELISNGTIEQILNKAGIKLPTSIEETGNTPSPRPTNTPNDEWKLVWSDEFDQSGSNLDTNGVDLDKWGYQNGTGAEYGLDGWGNNEQQYYTPENISVENGMLTITAKEESIQGKSYTSGKLYTEPTFSQTYGKFEAKMKLPAGDGLWPAFWMMPATDDYGGWASTGELDIMEARGRLIDEVGGAIHYGRNWPNNKFAAKEYHFPSGQNITDFHVYGVEWEPGEIRWYVDGELYQTINNWDSWGADQPAKYAFPAPFDKPFFMILNLAVGGNYDGGRVPSSSMMPAEMIVDYVRVYELFGRPYQTVIEPSVEVEPITMPYKEAINGNYVYDNAYLNAITLITEPEHQLNERNWNFVAVDTFAGSGDISLDTLDGIPFAKTNIAAIGNATHAIQLIQNVTVGKGRWYKLSFDAKSSTNRTMTVKIGGGDSRGWSVYSDNLDANLSADLQSYEMLFQMTADTDKLARLEFNMGLNNNPVWIGNVKLEETTAPDPYNELSVKEPLANGNHIYNGSFDLGYIHRMTYWQLQNSGDAVSTAYVKSEQRELNVDIVNGGDNVQNITYIQQGVSLISGNKYKLSFKARASEARTIAAGLFTQDGTAYEAPQTVSLTNNMESYEIVIDVGAAIESSGQLKFLLGGDGGQIYIDDVSLIRLTDNNIGGLPLNSQFLLKNSDFSNGMTNWTTHVQGIYDGWDNVTKAEVINDQLSYLVSSTGNNPWDVMLSQEDLQVRSNQTYIVSLDLKSSEARNVEIVLEDSTYHRYLSERVSISTEWETYRFEVPIQANAIVSFKLLLGKLEQAAPIGSHNVFVDNVRVEVKDARKQAFLAVNGYFDEGLDGWSTHIQGIYDGDSVANISAANKFLHATIEHSGANPWDIIASQTEAQSLKKGNTYLVTFVAGASTPTMMGVTVENGSYYRYLNKEVQLTTSVQSYSYTFTMAVDDVANLKFLFGKHSNDSTASHDIYIDNVRFELVGAKDATGEMERSTYDIIL